VCRAQSGEGARVLVTKSTDSTPATPTVNPFERDQAHEWVETEVPTNTAVQSTDASSDGERVSTTADQPLEYTRHPGSNAQEAVSRQSVSETRTVHEDGAITVEQTLRGELELVCTGCGASLRELPVSQRTFYEEVGVLQQDLHAAVRQQVRVWMNGLRTWVPLL